MSTTKLLILGAIAGSTIFVGLPIGRLSRPMPRTRASLNAIAIGILLFLFFDVLSHANEPVEDALTAASSGEGTWARFAWLATVFAVCVGVGLLSLVYYDRRMASRARAVGPGAATATAMRSGLIAGLSEAQRLSLFIALGIGLHNFSEGLAIGQSAANGEVSLATVLVVGFALHNGTEGFGIVAPFASSEQRPSWAFLIMAGIIGGGPTFLGTVIGNSFVNDTMFLAFLALAAGSILYVVVQLLKMAIRLGQTEALMWGLLVGLVLGFGTDYVLVLAGELIPARGYLRAFRGKTARMTLTHRVLHPKPIASLDEYVARLAGGSGLDIARSTDPWALIEVIEASGLRGRGGAGFPTGRKWRTVRENLSGSHRSTVVVNAAEGEPGTFKDRTIIRTNPYHVLEGALIAAHAVSAGHVVIALKRSFPTEVARMRAAVDEISAAGWVGDLAITVFEGPDQYLYGEETALLETLDGRLPFPRISPPFRRGVTEVVETAADLHSGSGLSAHVTMAGPDSESEAPPALVDNVETLANVPRLVARGADWFRNDGTKESPGTIVCTITGQVQTPGVAEIMLGTTLREAIDEIGGGPLEGGEITAVLPGVSGAIIPATHLDTPLTYEDMRAIGSGLGSAGYYVLDASVDPVAAIAGAVRFLSIESCGQCTPCKQDGMVLSEVLTRITRSSASERDIATVQKKAGTVADGARCSIGTQQQTLVNSLLEHYEAELHAHVAGTTPGTDPILIAELVSLAGGTARVDERHLSKQPDWTYEESWDGETPVERFTDHRAANTLDT